MQITRREDKSFLTLDGALDIGNAEELQQALCDLLDGSASAVVDLSAVISCDTAAVQLLLAARRTAERGQKHLKFESPHGALSDCIGALGLSLGELTGSCGKGVGGDHGL